VLRPSKPATELPEDDKPIARRTDTPDRGAHGPKEEEYEAGLNGIIPPAGERAEMVAPPNPPAQPFEDSLNRESEQLVGPLVQDLKRQKLIDQRLKTIKAMAQLGPRGKSASRVLCDALLDPSARVRLAAADALANVNPTLHRLVIPIMVDRELETRLECVRKIGQLGVEGKPAAPVVVYFKEQHQGGALAVDVLAAIAPDDKTVTASLATWLTRDSDPYVRLAAVKALPHMQGAKDHAGAIAQALRGDPLDAVRAAAASALGELGRDADQVLRLARTDPSARVREAAERALEKIHKPFSGAP
jgi:HEAT repeat protein